MNDDQARPKPKMIASDTAQSVLNAIQNAVIMVNEGGYIAFANWEAESFFGASAAYLARHTIYAYIPFGSPMLTLIDQVRERKAPVNEYRVDLSSPRLGADKLVDIYVAPVLTDPGAVVVVFQERSMADKIDRQLTHRAAARSVTGLASMLAHEIKNPLSGIRGAAQLLETSVNDDDRAPINIHSVLDHVKAIAQAGFARNVRIAEQYDPSLPAVHANRDQLIQVFLNLVKNASEAVSDRPDGEIILTTAYRPGIRISVAGTREKISLPLEFCVIDNGPGVPDDLLPHLFDPFVTTKTNGSGLGLALVAKIIGGHGGIVECDRQNNRTIFRVLLPVSPGGQAEDAF